MGTAPAPPLLLATTSKGKLGELTELLAPAPYTLLTPAGAGIDLQVEETGTTYADNAMLKALAYARAAGLPALADDSGLEVDALHGAPGVYSARYAGPQATDADRIALLLSQLDGVPDGGRTARFRCVMALATPDGPVDTVDGTCEGLIATAPRGSGGFGYDPIFYFPDLGRTMAELSPARKRELSHRGRAARAALRLLQHWRAR